jgi:hypothetical protein
MAMRDAPIGGVLGALGGWALGALVTPIQDYGPATTGGMVHMGTAAGIGLAVCAAVAALVPHRSASSYVPSESRQPKSKPTDNTFVQG